MAEIIEPGAPVQTPEVSDRARLTAAVRAFERTKFTIPTEFRRTKGDAKPFILSADAPSSPVAPEPEREDRLTARDREVIAELQAGKVEQAKTRIVRMKAKFSALKPGSGNRGQRWDTQLGVWVTEETSYLRKVLSQMRYRCNAETCPDYKNYGGRGIKVCKEWNYFATFAADMGPRPSPEHTIERKDNNLGYSKDNCIWASRTEQARNQRNTKLVMAQAEEIRRRLTAGETGIALAREFGISPAAISYIKTGRNWSDAPYDIIADAAGPHTVGWSQSLDQ
jgi:hypothetical protein